MKNDSFIKIDSLNIRFCNKLIKNGHNSNTVLLSIFKELKSLGIKNPQRVLSIALSVLSSPLEIKRRRRGRKYIDIAFPSTS